MEGLKDNISFQGFIFIGLIKVGEDPYVIEYNVRMGDPETEVIFPRIASDLMELLVATAEQRLAEYNISVDSTAATVMAVAGGIPRLMKKGIQLRVWNHRRTLLFHAGTQKGSKL